MFNGIIPNASRTGWIFAAAVFALMLLVCALHYRQQGRRQPIRAFSMYAFWLFFAFIAVLIVLPLPEIAPDFCTYTPSRFPQTVPFRFMREMGWASGYGRGFSVRQLLASHSFKLAFANIAVFVPLGIYLRVFTRRGFLTAVPIAFACTLGFELAQGTGLFGVYPCPYRQFDVDDLILNTLGGVLGYVAAAFVAYFFRRSPL